MQKMTDGPVTECQECGAPVQRVFHPVAVHFKGSGFYTTDYARKGKAKAANGTESSGSDGKDSKGGDSAKKSESSSSSSSSSGDKATAKKE